MENYFLDTNANILENDNLREPQKQAYYKVYEHFVINGNTNKHALLVIPTGVGKTGIMGILPYYISCGRVLIITPQLTVKDTVVDSLNTESHDNFWLKRKVLNASCLPSLSEYEGDKTTDETLNLSDIVILNIQKLQGRLSSSLINRLPEDFFDMIIIDEAHHSVANTWVEAIQHFSKAKVVKLTATPFRSDGEKIAGELVYRYKLSKAMANNYVKSLEMQQFIPDNVEFIMDNDETKTYTLGEVLKLKDEEWISRSVAYSKGCSSQVVNLSLKLLTRKKEVSGLPHKIIAVACSIEHAKQIEELYKQKGVRVAIIHSGMELKDIKQIKKDIDNNRYDVIVNVGMLGEGYDHKFLSIAAIFRPFRSKLTYEQFIGRILRYIPNAKPEDNIGQIVSHKYLYLEELWKEYKKEIDESKIICNLKENDSLIFEDDALEDGNNTKNREIANVISSDGNVLVDPYLETKLMRKAREEAEELNKKIKELSEILNITKPEAEKMLKNRENKNHLNRPDLEYNRSRKGVDDRIRDEIVPYLVVKYSIPRKDRSLRQFQVFSNPHYQWIKKNKDEGAMLAIYFNTYLKNEIGANRKDWKLDDFKKAEELLENQSEYIDSLLNNYYS